MEKCSIFRDENRIKTVCKQMSRKQFMLLLTRSILTTRSGSSWNEGAYVII